MIETIKSYFYNLFYGKKDAIILALNGELMVKDNDIRVLNENIDTLKQEFDVLNTKFNIFTQDEEIEEYWNSKRPKTKWTWKARPLFTDASVKVTVDPKIFYTNDDRLPTFKGGYDEIAIECLDWVAENIEYTKDSEGEFWQFAFETHKRRKGDCEDGSILIANMLLMSGVPYWRVRLNAGNVLGGGHAWVTYLSEKDNKWYVLDWCYWYNESKGLIKEWKDAEKYFSIWGSWNKKYMFGELPKTIVEE